MSFFVSGKLRGFAAFFCQSADVFCQVYCGGGVRDETFQNSKPILSAVQSGIHRYVVGWALATLAFSG